VKWIVALVALALAQQPGFSPAQRQDVVREVAVVLATRYLDEDQGRRVGQVLERTFNAGGLDAAATPDAFAAAIERLLQGQTHDIHLLVWAGAPVDILKRSPNLKGPSVGEVKRLASDIGYVEVRNFLGPGQGNPESRAQIDRAMSQVQGARTLIFDLRRNPGGDGASAAHLASYLFPGRTHLLDRVRRGKATAEETWTEADVAGRMPEVPVYILTSARTVSAGEAFAFALQQAGRAVVIGETTAGGGHSGNFATLPHGFTMFYSNARSFDPRTGKGWQSDGVHPDYDVAEEHALDVALKLAQTAR
jgi:Peptidase family S41